MNTNATDPAASSGWDGDAYAQQTAHHRALDDWFLDRCPPAATDAVVDVGCGAGEFTARLTERVPDGGVTGVEPDQSMLAAARRHVRPNLSFVAGSAERLDQICPPSSADLIVSRAVLHWIPLSSYGRCFAAMFTVLRPGGRMHLEFGGGGNVATVVRVLDEVAAQYGLGPAEVTFPDAGTVLELLEQAGFDVPADGVRTVAQRRAFDRERLLGFLHTQALPAYATRAPAATRAAFWADAQQHLDSLRRWGGSYDQTFVRLDLLARRPD